MAKKYTHIRVSTETHELLRDMQAVANLHDYMQGKNVMPSMRAIVHDALLEYQRTLKARALKVLGKEGFEQSLKMERMRVQFRDSMKNSD